jgi:acetolactate synthase-1/2/3 large subunit
MSTPVTAARALAAALVEQGVDTVFGTVGHGNLTFVDALLDEPSLRFVSAFHEQVAIHAADAYFRASGRVAVVTTTVGPGATNLTTGLGDALLDASGVVVITGGVPRDHAARDPLQALSVLNDDAQAEIFRPLTKRVITVGRPEDLVAQFRRARHEAVNGCPGPVLLHIPLDVFAAALPAAPSAGPAPSRPLTPHPDPVAVTEAVALLRAASRPVLYCGGGAQHGDAPAAVRAFAERLGIPVLTSMSGQGVVPASWPLALGTTGVVGNRPANTAIREADLVIAVGTRFPEMDANSWRPEFFAAFPPARLVHVDIEPPTFHRVFPADVALCADAAAGVAALDAAASDVDTDRFRPWTEQVTVSKAEWQDELAAVRAEPTLPFEPAHLLSRVRAALPDEAILVSGVGIRHAVAQHFEVRQPRSLVVASGFGTMGQEVAAPIGAALARPGTPVVGVIGDGALLACLAALPTAVAAAVPVTWIVLDNGGYASIAVYQAKHFGRYSGTYFVDPEGADYRIDYEALARSFGAWTDRVTDPAELDDKLTAALSQKGPAVLVVPVSRTPRIQGTGHWDVNDIMAAGARVSRS